MIPHYIGEDFTILVISHYIGDQQLRGEELDIIDLASPMSSGDLLTARSSCTDLSPPSTNIWNQTKTRNSWKYQPNFLLPKEKHKHWGHHSQDSWPLVSGQINIGNLVLGSSLKNHSFNSSNHLQRYQWLQNIGWTLIWYAVSLYQWNKFVFWL